MSGCNSCCGNCGSCGELVLGAAEVSLLETLAQIPFLPLYQKNGAPMYSDSEFSPEEYTHALLCLEKRGLISLDFDKPLKGTDAPGSFALTHQGQKIIEQLEFQGIFSEND